MRRWLRAKPIFGADRGHIHHRLLDRGLTTKQTVFLLYGFCGLCAVFSLTQSLANDVRLSIFVVCAFIAVAWAGVRYLGYGEFVLAGQFLRTGEFQRRLNAEMSFSSFEEKLAAAQDVAEVWNVIVEARAMFGFAGVQMNIAGQRLSEDWDATVAGPQYWKVRIDLPGNGFIELTRPVGSDALPTVVPRFLDAISIHLCNRLSPTGSEADLSCLKSNVVFQAGS
jgi:UDP-GlcNAc:undecaprenyl-phosphate GlcNAc-1-phosphate transferase